MLDDFVSSTFNQTNVRRVRIVEGFGSMPHMPVQCGVEMEKSQKTNLWSAAEEFARRKCQVSEAATKKTKLKHLTEHADCGIKEDKEKATCRLFFQKQKSKHKTPIMSLADVVLRSMVQGREQPENTRQ